MRAMQHAGVLGGVVRVADQTPGIAVPGRPRDRLAEGGPGKRAGVLAG
jgi:hypothetical protein